MSGGFFELPDSLKTDRLRLVNVQVLGQQVWTKMADQIQELLKRISLKDQPWNVGFTAPNA